MYKRDTERKRENNEPRYRLLCFRTSLKKLSNESCFSTATKILYFPNTICIQLGWLRQLYVWPFYCFINNLTTNLFTNTTTTSTNNKKQSPSLSLTHSLNLTLYLYLFTNTILYLWLTFMNQTYYRNMSA